MAKICRARFLGEQADKVVAIKMIQPQFSSNASFKKMFLDEIRVTFGLNHPNIAQTYDYGDHEEKLYTALEYVDGANLKQFLDRLKKKKFVFPIEISVHITSQVCQAMDYAHNYTDKLTNRKAKIIHRDISPHNIMISYDGAVKVIDFGIAKAETNSESTQVGTIKGKLSYLAPEYLDGLTLDPRYDIFGLGITLWEMLCGRKLFSADRDLAILKKIQACKVPPPSSINPNVTPELDEIVMKALKKDRSQRYETMDQFNRALVRYLYSSFPEFNASDLSYFAKELFADEIKKDRARFMEYGRINISPYIEEIRGEGENRGTGFVKELTGARQHDLDIRIVENEELNVAGMAADGVGDNRINVSQNTGSFSRNHKAPAGSASKNFLRRMKAKETGKQVQSLVKKYPLGAVAVSAGLAIFFAYYNPQFIYEVSGLKLSSLEKQSERNPAAKKKADNNKTVANEKRTSGTLHLLDQDPLAKVIINGEEVQTSGLGIQLPLYTKIELEVVKDGHIPYESSFQLTENSPIKEIELPELQKGRMGLLSTSEKYTGRKLYIKVNGKVRAKDLPITNMRVPAGIYNGIIYNPEDDSKEKIKIIIEKDKRYFID